MKDKAPEEFRPPAAVESPDRRMVVGGFAAGLAAIVGATVFAARCRAGAPAAPAPAAPARRTFSTVGAMLASHGGPIGSGAQYQAGGFRYVETPASAPLFDVQTQGGAKLMLVQAGEIWPAAAFGAVPGAWGASPADLADASGAIGAALRRIADAGGGTLAFEAGKAYRIDETILIRASGIKLMGSGARLVGSGRFVVRGGRGQGPGEGLVTGFSMTGFTMSDRFRGPVLEHCSGYELGNLARDNTAGTWINVHYCRDGRIHDCVAHNGEATKIAFLVLGGENNTGERCRVTGGEWIYAFQIKGGRNNWFRDCTIENVARMKHGFRLRGDAPWRASRTLGEYPFAEGNWDGPDVRRATRESGFSDCVVRNSGGVHFLATEFSDCAFQRCASHGAGGANRPVHALFAYRQPGGREGQLRVAEFHSSAARDSAIVISGEKGGQPMGGLAIENASITGAGKHGISCENCAAPRIEAPTVSDCGGEGIDLVDCSGWQVSRPAVTRCRRGLHATRTKNSFDPQVPGTLDDARRLQGNEIDLDCNVPYTLNAGGNALSVATTATRAVDFPQVFAEPGTRAWRVDLTFETIKDGSASRYRESFEFRSRAGAVQLIGPGASAGTVSRPVGPGRIVFGAGQDKVRVRIVPATAQPMRHSIVAIASSPLTR